MNVNKVNLGNQNGTAQYRIQSNADAAKPHVKADTAPTKGLSDEERKELVASLNETISGINERISFTIHEKTKRIVVRVINPQTHEVMREIPTKEAMRLLEHLQDFIGMLVDESR